MSRTTLTLVSTLVASAIASASACNMGSPAAPSTGGGGPDSGTAPPPPIDPPSVYVAKVKNILVGLPPTDAEVQAVVADPTQLKALIDGWMALPQYDQKMMTFFELAFQQTQISIIDLSDQTFPRPAVINGPTAPLLVQNVRESFARTVLELIKEQKPLHEAMTTTRFMMTPALMEFYGFLDSWQVDDAGKVTDRFRVANPALSITIEAAKGPIPLAETLDPTSANYMHWYDPDVVNLGATGAGCAEDPVVIPANGIALHFLLYGSIDGHKNAAGGTCNQIGGTAMAPQLGAADFNTWKMVTVRAPRAGEKPTDFWNLTKLRDPATTELVIVTPRVGFFSTPAFFANWPTNTSNQMRVTTNQSLIVATGAQIDGTDSTSPSTTPGLDKVHASEAACFGCHAQLDTTRSILASTYSWNYHDQTDPAVAAVKGLFAFQTVIQPVNSVADFGATLASHPLFPKAWVEKLCYYANSQACGTDDPEFQRVTSVFKGSGYSFSVLVRELMSSPLTTHAVATKTSTDSGEIIAVSRRDHLCAALNNRLGLTDICALDVLTKAQSQTVIPEIVSGLPSDGYGRGATAPVLPNQPSLFYRAGMENICAALAPMLIDSSKPPPGSKQWTSGQSGAAIADFVAIVMGLPPSDPRAPQAQTILTTHFTTAKQQGAAATDALRSTFIVACLAPSAVSIGL